MQIPVSFLNAYDFCKRTIYLKEVAGIIPKANIKKTRGLVGHAVRKELSLRQQKIIGKISSTSEIENRMIRELDNVLCDFPYVYKDLSDDPDTCCEKYLPEIRIEVLPEIKIITERLTDITDELGIDGAVKYLTPRWVDYSIKSDKLKLSGKIDKVMKRDNLVPIEIKTSNPGSGIWGGDRLQICAYAMLLEEKFNEKIPFGFVEYTKIAEQRPVMTTEQIRRRVINARDSVIDILEGEIPEICPHGSGKKCEACDFRESCYEI